MQLLHIRYLQFKRELGIWFFIILTAAIYFSVSFVSDNNKHNIVFSALIAFAIFSFHQNRKDLSFVKKYFNSSKLQICVNYNLTVLPFTLGFVFNSQFLAALLIHLFVSLTPFFVFKTQGAKLSFITKYIPPHHFEWIAGIRNNFPILVILLLIMLVLSPVKLFAMAGLFLFNTVLLGFFSFNEPRVMLNPSSLPVKKFLHQKVLFFIKVIFVINAPVLIINSIFQTDALWFNLFFLVGFMMLAATTVYIKYVNYSPNTTLSFSMDFIILISSIILPYLLPLGVYIFFSNKKKAQKNLLNYLDDNS